MLSVPPSMSVAVATQLNVVEVVTLTSGLTFTSVMDGLVLSTVTVAVSLAVPE